MFREIVAMFIVKKNMYDRFRLAIIKLLMPENLKVGM